MIGVNTSPVGRRASLKKNGEKCIAKKTGNGVFVTRWKNGGKPHPAWMLLDGGIDERLQKRYRGDLR